MACAKGAALLSLCASVIAVPYPDDISSPSADVSRRTEDFYLRIMPLGASITKGDPAAPGTNGNGYRKALRDQLLFDGWQVNMVGSTAHGDMQDSECEAYPGWRVAEIANAAKPALTSMKPNLILVNAGTNDGRKDFNVDTIGNRMTDMVVDCFTSSPDTVVVLSTLIPNTKNKAQFDSINAQYRNVAAQLRQQGYHILLAEMDDGLITLEDIWDGTHPYESGFLKMASVWHNAINEADKEGWIKKPSADVNFEDSA